MGSGTLSGFVFGTVLLGAALFASAASAQAEADLVPELRKATAEVGRLVRDNVESLHVGDVIFVTFGAADRWAAEKGAMVPFFMEGRGASNYFAEYIAYFKILPEESDFLREMRESNGDTRKGVALVDFIQTGGKGWRMADWAAGKEEDGRLIAPLTFWQDGDGGCCPSGKAEIAISLGEGLRLQLVELPAGDSRR